MKAFSQAFRPEKRTSAFLDKENPRLILNQFRKIGDWFLFKIKKGVLESAETYLRYIEGLYIMRSKDVQGSHPGLQKMKLQKMKKIPIYISLRILL
jgi:hypothetical protein